LRESCVKRRRVWKSPGGNPPTSQSITTDTKERNPSQKPRLKDRNFEIKKRERSDQSLPRREVRDWTPKKLLRNNSRFRERKN